MTVRGTVINIHHHGATARLEDGSLATISAAELAANRPAYASSLAKRKPLEFDLTIEGRHPSVMLADLASASPAVAAKTAAAITAMDDAFEARMDAYLKATQEWAPPDQAPPAERHFIRKKRRARIFEARAVATEKPPA